MSTHLGWRIFAFALIFRPASYVLSSECAVQIYGAVLVTVRLSLDIFLSYCRPLVTVVDRFGRKIACVRGQISMIFRRWFARTIWLRVCASHQDGLRILDFDYNFVCVELDVVAQ